MMGDKDHWNKRHGKFGTKIYQTWANMKYRCLNKNCSLYENYGGRGITVCDDWMIFENFYRDMGDVPDGMSLDRIDNDKGYCKDNCRWATRFEQQGNTRSSVKATINGVTKSVREWANETGLEKELISRRLGRGWSDERAVLTPKGKYRMPRR